MSGTFMDIDVPPTLISFAVAAADADRVVSTEFKKAGSTLVHIYQENDEFGVIDFDSIARIWRESSNCPDRKKFCR